MPTPRGPGNGHGSRVEEEEEEEEEGEEADVAAEEKCGKCGGIESKLSNKFRVSSAAEGLAFIGSGNIQRFGERSDRGAGRGRREDQTM